MKYLMLFLLFLTPALAKAPSQPIKIGIVDTGLNLNDPRFTSHLCVYGHKDFTGSGIEDTLGHGTHIAGIIQKYAGEGNYCFLIYKYYSSIASSFQNVKNEQAALEKAVEDGVKIVNFSGGGPEFNEDEYLTISDHPDVTFVVAAGNESKNIETPEGKFYPASYFTENLIVVGDFDIEGVAASTSNWATRKISWEIGERVNSTLPNGHTGYMSGTSQATAIRTGKLVRKMLNAK
jgi:subtilisin family serine protease